MNSDTEEARAARSAAMTARRDALTTRIQGTATIMTAIASVSVVALFQTVSNSDGGVFALAILGVLAWFGALTTLALALAGQDPLGRFRGATEDPGTADATEIKIANKRLAWGFGVSLVAAAMTVVALALARYHHTTVSGTMVLTRDGARATRSVCGKAHRSLDGDIREDTLDSDVVIITVAAGDCSDQKVTLRFPRTQVAVLEATT